MNARIAVVYDEGAATPTQTALGLRDLADIHFVVARSPHVRDVMPLLEEYGTLSMLDRALMSCALPVSVDGIVTFSEPMLADTAQLAERLRLPYHTPECAKALRDKQLQRTLLVETGVDHVRFQIAADPASVTTALEFVGLPAVVKPNSGEGSRDAHLVYREADAAAVVDHFADRWARNEPSTPPVLIVEEFLAGAEQPDGIADYVSVETAVVDGVATQLAVTGKFPLYHPFRESGNFWPSHLPASELAFLSSRTADALAALGVRSGICHTEFKLTPEGPRIIEVNGRLGGYIAELALRSTGTDLIAIAGAIALGLPVSLSPLRPSEVYFQFHHPAPRWARQVVAVSGQSSALSLAGIDGHQLLRGLPVPIAAVASTHFDQLRGHASSLPEAMDLLNRASAELRYTYVDSDGNEVVVPGTGLLSEGARGHDPHAVSSSRIAPVVA